MKEQLLLWHKFTETQDMTILHELLADDVTFHSPFVWQPKEGKLITSLILKTAASIFENFNYVRAIVSEHDWALEFEANIGELSLRGIDLIKITDDKKIIDFEVMIRPANGLQALGIEMGKRLEAIKSKK
jgi:hypothetical protein